MSSVVTPDPTQSHLAPGVMVVNGLKAIGEIAVVPGSSLIVDGDIKSGALHVLGGLAAKWAFGPIGLIVVATNSYTKSVTGKSLYQHFTAHREAARTDTPATTTI